MTDLSELLARVEAATGPDRELDHELTTILLNLEWRRVRGRTSAYSRDTKKLVYLTVNRVPEITTSIDAALALVERVLPDTVRVALVQQPNGEWGASVLRVQPDDAESTSAFGPSAPLAILAALLKALQQPSPTSPEGK